MSLVVDRPRLAPARPETPAPLAALCTAVIVCGIIARLWPRSALWLDEALTIAIAEPPLRELPGLLKADGAPPLYYAFLHVWMRLFGDGDYIVRLPSILASLAALGLFAHVARRLFSERAALIAVTLAAANPFAIRYATETRMYAFVVLEVLLGILAVEAVLSGPTRRNVVALAAVAAALLYTHYWGLYLVAGTGAVMAAWWAWLAHHRPERLVGSARGHPVDPATRGPRAVCGALVLAGVAFLPWLPIFVFQSRHTATPWAKPAVWWQAFDIVYSQAGGHQARSLVLGSISWALMAAAVFLHHLVPGRGRATLLLTAVFFASAQAAVIGSITSGSGFSSRYSSILLPFIVLLVSAGITVLRTPAAQTAAIAVIALIGLHFAQGEMRRPRTPAPRIATQLEARANPGDVVVFCPDQLGPSLRREMGDRANGLIMGTFPDWSEPARVVWIDYLKRYREADAEDFAAQAEALSGSNAVWLVWSNTYPPTESSCSGLRDELTLLRGFEETVIPDEIGRYPDHAGLLRYG